MTQLRHSFIKVTEDASHVCPGMEAPWGGLFSAGALLNLPVHAMRVPGLALGAGDTMLTQARPRHSAAWHQHALLGKGRRQEVNRGPGRLVALRGDRPSSAAATPASPGGTLHTVTPV